MKRKFTRYPVIASTDSKGYPALSMERGWQEESIRYPIYRIYGGIFYDDGYGWSTSEECAGVKDTLQEAVEYANYLGTKYNVPVAIVLDNGDGDTEVIMTNEDANYDFDTDSEWWEDPEFGE